MAARGTSEGYRLRRQHYDVIVDAAGLEGVISASGEKSIASPAPPTRVSGPLPTLM